MVRLVFDYTKRFWVAKPAQLVQGKCDARGVCNKGRKAGEGEA